MYSAPEFVEAGGLMSYTLNYTEQFRRATVYVPEVKVEGRIYGL